MEARVSVKEERETGAVRVFSRDIFFRCPFIIKRHGGKKTHTHTPGVAKKYSDRANEVPGFEASLKRLWPVAPRQLYCP